MTPGVSRTLRPARPRSTTIVAWAMWAVALILVAISLSTGPARGPDGLGTPIPRGGAALMLVSVGAILVSRLPHHLIGWLLVFGGLVLAVSGATSGLADYGLNLHPGSVPGAIWFAWTSQWAWAPEIAILFILLPLFYPTGRLPSARWRVVVVIAAALVVIGSLGSGQHRHQREPDNGTDGCPRHHERGLWVRHLCRPRAATGRHWPGRPALQALRDRPVDQSDDQLWRPDRDRRRSVRRLHSRLSGAPRSGDGIERAGRGRLDPPGGGALPAAPSTAPATGRSTLQPIPVRR